MNQNEVDSQPDKLSIFQESTLQESLSKSSDSRTYEQISLHQRIQNRYKLKHVLYSNCLQIQLLNILSFIVHANVLIVSSLALCHQHDSCFFQLVILDHCCSLRHPSGFYTGAAGSFCAVMILVSVNWSGAIYARPSLRQSRPERTSDPETESSRQTPPQRLTPPRLKSVAWIFRRRTW